MSYRQLLNFMAQACHYAQEHVGCPDAWTTCKSKREAYLQTVSFQMACFLAQNTKDGGNGVDWDVVLDELADNTINENSQMTKSIEEWEKILKRIVDELGGWNDDHEGVSPQSHKENAVSEKRIHHVVAVTDSNGPEALYIDGVLKTWEESLYAFDIASATEGMAFELSHMNVDIPVDMTWPEKLESLMPYLD